MCQPVLAEQPDPVDSLLGAEADHGLIPLVSALVPDLDRAGAMALQRRYVTKRLGPDHKNSFNTDRLAGFKAGLTSANARQRFGLNGPVAGVLFASGRLENHVVVGGSAFHRPVIETELGFVLNRSFDRKIQSLSQLKAAIREVVPVVELPDLGFADMKALRGVDIIAANVSSRQFIVGEPFSTGQADLNTLDVVLYRNGEIVNQGQGSDAMKDQWQALLWLANTMIDQGYLLEPGQVLITGVLGKMVPGQSGRYRAVYGELGAVFFDIR